ncbi:MAG: methylamine dehydrogenase (amicyanin) light chain, partial [Proteobacteria bacterium]|nr:methylamine dehydrogenase (amicyanin) light chain [Pseudomonadota bacterium]
MSAIDKLTERFSRGLARGTSRRSSLAWVGGVLTGAAIFPVLPMSRAGATPHGNNAARPAVTSGNPQDPGDRTQCDYWRYCAIDGFLCTCCGGTVNTCPPGTEMSPITWIGTCTNPADGRAYVIS